MHTIDHAQPRKPIARTAGLLYLIVVLTGTFSIAYVPSQLFVRGDTAATVGNIADNLLLFRLGIVAGFACYIAFLLLPLALYRLLSPVDQRAAVMMVALAVVSVPLAFVNIGYKLNVVTLLSGAEYLQAFTIEQRHAMVMHSLDAYRNGILVSELFWGLWLLPFGYLVFTSGFLPRILGILLMVGCFGYLIDVVGHTLFLGYPKSALAGVVTLPASLGEIGTCLWLVIVGAREATQPNMQTT
jgi:hypothetical protein